MIKVITTIIYKMLPTRLSELKMIILEILLVMATRVNYIRMVAGPFDMMRDDHKVLIDGFGFEPCGWGHGKF